MIDRNELDATPAPAMVLAGREYRGVCFSREHAERLFREMPPRSMPALYCVAPPRAALVTSAAEAGAFFADAGRPGPFADVGAFHEKFGLARYDGAAAPDLMTDDVADFRIRFMQEELDEFETACAKGRIEDAVDALVDLVYVALGTAHMLRVPFDDCWDEVQRANMAKERAAGADDPRSTRKNSLDVVKPAGWRAPDHGPILRRALDRAKASE